MHNGLTHWSQVITNWELVGLGMFGVSAQGSDATGSNRSLPTVGSVSWRQRDCHTNQVTTTQVPLGSRVELWEPRFFPPDHLNTIVLNTAQMRSVWLP